MRRAARKATSPQPINSTLNLAMTFEITIKPSDHRFECEADETILAGALRGGLLLPYGCRDGACASCKSRILSGDVDYGVYQASTLSEQEKVQGYVLPCVAKPRSALTLECREVRKAGDIQIRKLPSRIEKIEIVARGEVRRARLNYLRELEGKAARIEKSGDDTTQAGKAAAAAAAAAPATAPSSPEAAS